MLHQVIRVKLLPTTAKKENSMPDIKFSCPKCQGKLVVDARGAGRNVPCPECEEVIQIPSQDELMDAEQPGSLAKSQAADPGLVPGGTCTQCGKETFDTKEKVVSACNAAGIPLTWGDLGPTLKLGSLAGTGINGIYDLLYRSDADDARAFQKIIGSWTPDESCPDCGEQWCNECIKGLLPNKHLSEPPHCNCQ